MNVIEAWDDFTSSEKLMFQNCCRKILSRTFLVGTCQLGKFTGSFPVEFGTSRKIESIIFSLLII